jgi:SAM-dependent methyltransferase
VRASVTSHPFQSEFDRVGREYSALLREHGDVPAAVRWRDRSTQERRFLVLSEVGDLRAAKVLDFGCGTGHLLDILRTRCGFAGEYVGYDLSERMVAAAQHKFPDARFECRDILADGIPEDFDYALVSGTFNGQVSDNWSLMTELVKRLFARVRSALAFNLISSYVEFRDAGLWYASPDQVFRFCKEEVSPCVALRHDYLLKDGVLPYEFTVYVRRADVTRVPRQLDDTTNGGAG